MALSSATLAEIEEWVALYATQTAGLEDAAVARVWAAFEEVTDWSDPAQTVAAALMAMEIAQASRQSSAGLSAQYAAVVMAILTGRPQGSIRPDIVQMIVGRRGVRPFDVWSRPIHVYREVLRRGGTSAEAFAAARLRAEVLASMDLAMAQRDGVLAQLGIEGALKYRRVIRPELSRTGTCGLCIAASDRVYNIGTLMPIHARCVPGDAKVRAENVLAVSRRDYAGPLVILTTASGEKLRITANHPILTNNGWVPAGLVNVGHQIVRDRLAQGITGGGPHEHKGPTTVEQVWRAATVDHGLHARTVPLAPEDFHGDGGHGEVDVVSTRGLFAHEGHVSFGEPLGNQSLVTAHRGGLLLPSRRGLAQSFFDRRDATQGRVGRAGDLSTLCSRHAAHADSAGLGTPSQLDAFLHQPPLDRVAANAVLLSEREHRLSRQVGVGDDIGRQGDSAAPRFDPAFSEFTGQGRGAYGQLGRDLRERLAGDVELDRVVDKSWVEGPHVVYNLHTGEGWYSSDSCIVSNCKCIVLPIIGDIDPGMRLNQADLGQLYTDAGSTSAAALKRIKYRVEEHGELGPVLVNADHNFRAYDAA